MRKPQSAISTVTSELLVAIADRRCHPAIVGGLSASISDALQAPPIRQLINLGASREGIEQVLAVMVSKYAHMLHIGGTIGPHEPMTIARMLIQEYPLCSLDDFNVMFTRGVTGRYGKVMGFDISIIFFWASEYQVEWAEVREQMIDKLIEPEPETKPERPESNAIPRPDIDKEINELLDNLKDSKVKPMPSLTREEIRREGQSEPPRKKAIGRPSTPQEYVEKWKRKQEWIKLFTESDGGDGWKLKEGAPSFETWIAEKS